jgi:hypothetical protein
MQRLFENPAIGKQNSIFAPYNIQIALCSDCRDAKVKKMPKKLCKNKIIYAKIAESVYRRPHNDA